jgi:hypothetical protein
MTALPKTYRLIRPGAVDLVFDGVLLAERSSRRPGDESQTHWTEMRLYRTASGKYVTEVIGRTTIADQVDRIKVVVHDRIGTIRAGLARRGRSKETDQMVTYLPDMAIGLLEEAAEADPKLRPETAERI